MALEFHLKYKFNLKQEYMTVWHLWLLVWGLYFPVQLLNNSKILSTFAYEATSYIASIKEPIFPPYSKIWDWLSSTQWKKRKKKYTISVPIFKKSMLHAVASHQGLNSFIFLQSAPSTHPHNNPPPPYIPVIHNLFSLLVILQYPRISLSIQIQHLHCLPTLLTSVISPSYSYPFFSCGHTISMYSHLWLHLLLSEFQPSL